MNRHEEITSFLQIVYQFNKYYPNDFDINLIYSLLSGYGFSSEEISQTGRYESLFIELQNSYIFDKNINVYKHELQPDFLQFNHVENFGDSDFVKIYLSIKPDDVNIVARRIINLLRAYPQIEHISKLANSSRSDQLVLRIKDPNYARLIADYINNSPEISDCLRLTNPFIPRYGKVGLAYDKDLSYNSTISYLVKNYILSNENIESISSDDFINFVKLYFKELTDTDDYAMLNSLINSTIFKNNYNRIAKELPQKSSIDYVINNYLHIIEELVRLYDKDNDIDAYIEIYNYSNDPKENNNRRTYIQGMLDKISKEDDILLKKNIIDDYIKYAYFKYGSNLDEVSKRLASFATYKITNPMTAENYITRDRNFRALFANISSEDIYKITNNDIYLYVEKILGLTYDSSDMRTAE